MLPPFVALMVIGAAAGADKDLEECIARAARPEYSTDILRDACMNERRLNDCVSRAKRRLLGRQQARDACSDEYRERRLEIERRLRADHDAAEKDVQEKRRAEEETEYRRRMAEQQVELERQSAEVAAAEEQERMSEEALRKKCGKDYMRVAVGMPFKRVRECAGPFELIGQVRRNSDGAVASVYDAEGGRVYVIQGKVASWAKRR
jgi:hypothetical protein